MAPDFLPADEAAAIATPDPSSVVEALRIAAFYRYHALDSFADERFDDIVAIAAKLFDTPISLISLIDEQRQWFKAGIGRQVKATPREATFCYHAVRQGRTLVVPDAAQDPRFQDAPAVLHDPGVRFYAGAPLVTPEGHAIGAICVIDTKERRDFSEADEKALEALSRLVMGHMELLRQARLNAERSRRAALRERLVTLTAEAPDFEAAIQAACVLLVEATQARFCHVFRMAADRERIHFVEGAGGDIPGSQTQPLAPVGYEVPVMAALLQNRQVIERGAGPEGGPDVLIATPIGLLQEHYAFALGLEGAAADLDDLAALMTDMAAALRPLLRRVRDEERALIFQRAVEASLDPVLITEAEPQDEPGPRIVYANEAFTRESDYTAAEAMGRSPRFLQGPGTSQQARDNIRAALKAWQPIRQEILNYHKDGSPHLVELNIAPVANASGWFTHWISIQRDVTRQREIERERERMSDELNRLISGMPGALMRVGKNADGISTALYSSPSIKAVTGYAPEEIGPGFMARHLSVQDREALRECVAQTVASGEARIEFHFQHRNGTRRLISAHLQGNPMGRNTGEVIMTWSDITNERLLSAQLAQAAKLAQLGEVATGMAHEMNQPLAGISLAAENASRILARMPDVPAKVQEKLELISSLAQRASDTIEHMRIFGRVGTGPSGAVELAAVLTGAEHLVQAKLRSGGVQLVNALPAGLRPVLGKPIPLEQVMINLISNACDAYAGMAQPPPAARRSITVTAREEGREEGARITILVQDHAGGIPADILPRIFEPFFTTKDVGQGTGLGLSISYGIITEMGGTIAAQAALGGTLFSIDLPAAEALA